MKRASFGRKAALLSVLAGFTVGLVGCASHYPYYGDEGVYYGKSHGHYGDYYPYGHSSHVYSYRVYDYNRGYWYNPYRNRYGYGYGYYDYRYRDRDDHDRHDDGRGGEVRASDELRRITRDQPRVRLDAPRNHPSNLQREKRETVTVDRREDRGSSDARAQLRQARPTPSTTSRGAPRPAPRPEVNTDAGDRHREGGIATPRDRRR